ncbi:MAG: serine/threonine protein kinase [Muribaculaceae bacterium]|nr:serine/threonine protein kinase [Muribaculaceae bacterium]
MPEIIRIQDIAERRQGIYYEFDASLPPLGEGGMGRVYSGYRVDTMRGNERRPVAIKCLRDGLPGHVIERARREASIRLRNDNLVEMLAFIEVRDNQSQAIRYHVVSELLNGVDINDMIDGKCTNTLSKGAPIAFVQEMKRLYDTDPYTFAIKVTKSVLSGLLALHQAGYIHRDIDPSNIMLTADGKIKLIDFGIAKLIDTLGTQDRGFTHDGQFIGKPNYAAPELVLGDIKHQDTTTDIYAVGIMLFQLIVGHVPFDGPMHEVLKMQQNKRIPLEQVRQRALRRIIDKATRKKQNERYGTATQFLVALEDLESRNLPYPDRSLPSWVGKVAIGGVASCVSIALVIFIIDLFDSQHEVVDNPSGGLTNQEVYENQLNLLHAGHSQSLDTLEMLAAKGVYEAAATLGVLYRDDEYSACLHTIPPGSTDSAAVFEIRRALHITPNPRLSHRFIEMAVNNNPQDYKMLIELAEDYLWPNDDTTGKNVMGTSQNLARAKALLGRARECAKENGDIRYTDIIDDKLNLDYLQNIEPNFEPSD